MEKKIIRTPRGTELRATARLTGRYIMKFERGAHGKVSAALNDVGIPGAREKPFRAKVARAMPHGRHLVLPKLGFAIVDPHSAAEDALLRLAAKQDEIHALVPEGLVRLASGSADYVRGWRDATDAIAAKLLSQPEVFRIAGASFSTGPDFTAALAITGVSASQLSGAGVKIAILDTGLDCNHPDFRGRDITCENLVGDGMACRDANGHGTHCAGIAAGPRSPVQGPRYGIAYESSLYAARVLNDDGGIGSDGSITQGIHRAVGLGCAVISMSLESIWQDGQDPTQSLYEELIHDATAAGSLVVVAAGNHHTAVGAPGNSPSALTVGAIDQALQTASFSNRATATASGVKGPDVAAPGVGIHSSWLTGAGSYKSLDGTSQATAFVAGIAALLAQSDSTLRGQKLKDAVIAKCRPLQDPVGEVGNGLVQAP